MRTKQGAKPSTNRNEEETRILQQKGLQYNCTDVGNSERFTDKVGDDLRYVTEHKKWITWKGNRWEIMEGGIYELAKETVRNIYDEAKHCENRGGQTELTNWARKSQYKQRIEPMLSLAADSLAISINEFDTESTSINCLNGVLNLTTGELASHGPEQRVMKRAEANYLPSSPHEAWDKFLNEIFLNDSELIAFMKRAIGYSMTGMIRENCLFIAYGLGANGKTTLFETILEILGDYGKTTEFSTFLNTDKSDARNREAVGTLKGARFAIASETDSSRKWNEALIKKLTGGDTLTGAKLYGSSYDFQPTHKLWFQANHLPGVRDASHGFWRRPIVIPFKAKFEGSTIDANLRRKLLRERDGIFRWMVEGALEYVKDGLGEIPRACRDAIDHYKNENDTLGRFIKEKLHKETGQTIGVEETYRIYETWCLANKEEPGPMRYFVRNMEERGIDKRKTRDANMFVGYRKKGPPELEISNDNESTETVMEERTIHATKVRNNGPSLQDCLRLEAGRFKSWDARHERLKEDAN